MQQQLRRPHVTLILPAIHDRKLQLPLRITVSTKRKLEKRVHLILHYDHLRAEHIS